MIKQETEIVSARVEAPAPEEGKYLVLLKRGILVGTAWREPGSVVNLPCDRAIELCVAGNATPAGPFGVVAVMKARVAEALSRFANPKPEPADARPSGKRIKLISGNLFQDGRSYGPEDGFFEYRGDVVSLLAMQTAEEGSQAAEHARQASRNRPKIATEHPLSPDERKRLARLRRNSIEPTKAEIAKAVRFMALASE